MWLEEECVKGGVQQVEVPELQGARWDIRNQAPSWETVAAESCKWRMKGMKRKVK